MGRERLSRCCGAGVNAPAASPHARVPASEVSRCETLGRTVVVDRNEVDAALAGDGLAALVGEMPGEGDAPAVRRDERVGRSELVEEPAEVHELAAGVEACRERAAPAAHVEHRPLHAAVFAERDRDELRPTRRPEERYDVVLADDLATARA